MRELLFIFSFILLSFSIKAQENIRKNFAGGGGKPTKVSTIQNVNSYIPKDTSNYILTLQQSDSLKSLSIPYLVNSRKIHSRNFGSNIKHDSSLDQLNPKNTPREISTGWTAIPVYNINIKSDGIISIPDSIEITSLSTLIEIDTNRYTLIQLDIEKTAKIVCQIVQFNKDNEQIQNNIFETAPLVQNIIPQTKRIMLKISKFKFGYLKINSIKLN